MSILGRTRTRSTGPASPKTKTKAPLYPTSSTSSTTNDTSEGTVRLTIGGIANMFIKLRHLERQSKRSHTITCSSGTKPLTHPHVQESSQADEVDARAPLMHKDTYICAGNGGVDVIRLLRATRSALVEQASIIGANALVDESWSYIINEPKNRPRGQYKVCVQYSASAIQTNCRDILQPVAMDRIECVPGLMTVISRNGE